MVFALAGDSTMTRFFATSSRLPPVDAPYISQTATMLPDLGKREKLAGMLGDDALEFQFQQ